MTASTHDDRGWLSGASAVVTGGANGIGRAVVARFVREGANVVVLDRDRDGLDLLSREFGNAVVTVAGDVLSTEDTGRSVTAAVDTFGKLDVFVGNAAVYDFGRRLEQMEPAVLTNAFDEIFAVNVKAYALGARLAAAPLRSSRGCMIFTVSSSGFHAGGGGILYVASKHAVVGLVRQLAHELAPDVRVNGVAPGGTDTALGGASALDPAARTLREEDWLRGAMERTPLGFLAEPEDHAGAYVLLASRANARAMTGIIITSDCGMDVRGGGARRTRR